MRVEVLADAEAVAIHAARWLAEAARTAVQERGRFTVAFSGGHTVVPMLGALALQDLPWPAVFIFQVDERVAGPGDPDRNLTELRRQLVDPVGLPPANLHAMPVEHGDLDVAAADYARALALVAGAPPVLDVVQLGLGPDGHTASLVPGDPVLDVADRDVAITGLRAGRRRMTLTYRVLDQARQVLWVVTGPSKAAALPRLVAGDPTIPGGRVRCDRAVLITDAAAAVGLPPQTPKAT